MPEAIVSVAQMRSREALTWAAGVSQESVIERAGRAVAAVVERMTCTGAPILVIAGQGHNGDDAVVAANSLRDRAVACVQWAKPAALSEARAWLAQHRGNSGALVIDGLFGIGLNRAIAGDAAELVANVNESGLRVVSVDVPSGLDADTGEARGPVIAAATTVTLGAVKRGLLSESAARWVGRLELAHDIGLRAAPSSPGEGKESWTLAEDFGGFPPRRGPSTHKGSYGHLAILAGSRGYHGAAVLAAQGALRSRPGLVTVFTEESCYIPVASQLCAAMVRGWAGERLDAPGFTAVLMGPGLASPALPYAMRVEARRVWGEAACPVVVDASALDWLEESPGAGAGLRVITPHPGEAARCLGITSAAVQADRFEAARHLATRWNWPGGSERLKVVLKGRHTLVGSVAEGWYVNPSGNPGLAQGGTGDVLAGMIGGLLAQPKLAEHPLLALRYAAWRHGAASDSLESSGATWTTEDLVAELGRPSR